LLFPAKKKYFYNFNTISWTLKNKIIFVFEILNLSVGTSKKCKKIFGNQNRFYVFLQFSGLFATLFATLGKNCQVRPIPSFLS
jgi:hypothetical protein